MEEDEESSEQWEEAGLAGWRSSCRDWVRDRAGPEGGEVPGGEVGEGRPARRVLGPHPGPVLGGRAQRGEELLPSPVIAALSAGTDFVAPEHQRDIINILFCLLLSSWAGHFTRLAEQQPTKNF